MSDIDEVTEIENSIRDTTSMVEDAIVDQIPVTNYNQLSSLGNSESFVVDSTISKQPCVKCDNFFTASSAFDAICKTCRDEELMDDVTDDQDKQRDHGKLGAQFNDDDENDDIQYEDDNEVENTKDEDYEESNSSSPVVRNNNSSQVPLPEKICRGDFCEKYRLSIFFHLIFFIDTGKFQSDYNLDFNAITRNNEFSSSGDCYDWLLALYKSNNYILKWHYNRTECYITKEIINKVFRYNSTGIKVGIYIVLTKNVYESRVFYGYDIIVGYGSIKKKYYYV